MKKHKWKRMKCNIEAYECEKCGCEKYAISYLYGGWEYYLPGEIKPLNKSFNRLTRPECTNEKSNG